MLSGWDRFGVLMWRAAEALAAAIYTTARAVEGVRQYRRLWLTAVMAEVARRRATRREGFRLTPN